MSSIKILTEQNKFNEDGSLSTKDTYKYIYDKYGNWTQEVENLEFFG